MSEIVPAIVFQLGFGGIAGFIVGYAFKKFTKLLMMVAALFFCVIAYLAYAGVLNINFDALIEAASRLLGLAGHAANWIASVIVGILPFAGSFTVGLFLGFKTG
jgi:uncharacterized membrane protein (Fun14 family)